MELSELLPKLRAADVARALILLTVGLLAARALPLALERALSRRLSPQHLMLMRRGVAWLVVGITLVTVLRQLGFDLSVLVGAAGVFTVALGFASQTSASNLISGLFLIGERPFVVGDIITVGARTGEVISIDLLSVKLRTFDNLFVRIPNELLLKSELVNVSYYAIRRVDFTINVARDADLAEVERTLHEVIATIPVCLDEPAPLLVFDSFSQNTQTVLVGVWTHKDNLVEVRRRVPGALGRALISRGLELPLPESIVRTRPPA